MLGIRRRDLQKNVGGIWTIAGRCRRGSDVSPSFATEAARGEQLFYPLSFLIEGMSHILFSATAIQFEIYPSFSALAPF